MRGTSRGQVMAVIAGVLLAACSGGSSQPKGGETLTLVSGDGQIDAPGGTLPESLVVRLVDGQSAGVSGATITWSVQSGAGSLAPTSTVTDGSGRAAASWTLGAAVGPQSVTASTGGSTVTFAATATTGPLPHLGVTTQPTAAFSGVSFSTHPVLQLLDGSGAPLAQAGVAVKVALSSPPAFSSLSGTTTATTGAGGAATFSNLSIRGPVGNYTLRFTASGFSGVNAAPLQLTNQDGRIPLTDMGTTFLYLGQYSGGLYPNGANSPPAAHAAAGAARARAVTPRGTNGNPNASGSIVLMSIGMSNATQEWCGLTPFNCESWTFTGQALADPAVDRTALRIMNGAKGGQTAGSWDNPTDPNYDRVRDSVLAPQGLTEAQVQIVWLKDANPDPVDSLPSPTADANTLVMQFGGILRALKTRYPNLQMVFMASRIYAGYAVSNLNPEPYAYQSGLAVKRVIQAQIDQMANGGTVVDQLAGNLNYSTGVAPWVAWGPYLWADGLNPRSDGLIWVQSDFESDGTHPGTSGETKVGGMLLNFFKTDPRTSCWFTGQACP
ncbi:MAG: Ig-like domain-containing protein [Gemmatimonadales bacterium]